MADAARPIEPSGQDDARLSAAEVALAEWVQAVTHTSAAATKGALLVREFGWACREHERSLRAAVPVPASAPAAGRAGELMECLRDLLAACESEVNEKGGGGYLLARMSDARDAMALAAVAPPLRGANPQNPDDQFVHGEGSLAGREVERRKRPPPLRGAEPSERDAALEEAAKVCDGIAENNDGQMEWNIRHLMNATATRIRALGAGVPLRGAEAGPPDEVERLAATLLCEVGKIADPRLADVRPVDVRAVERKRRSFSGSPHALTDEQVLAVLAEYGVTTEKGDWKFWRDECNRQRDAVARLTRRVEGETTEAQLEAAAAAIEKVFVQRVQRCVDVDSAGNTYEVWWTVGAQRFDIEYEARKFCRLERARVALSGVAAARDGGELDEATHAKP